MPCKHKFSKYLNLDNLDFEPTTLIVGTFNPEWPVGNTAEWFYGRIQNNFWNVLPRLYGEESMRCSKPKEWKAFCKRHKIAITDLITSIDDVDENSAEDVKALAGFSDKKLTEFKDHNFTDIEQIIKENPTITSVYLTRSANETFWKRRWKPIMNYCSVNNIKSETLMTPSNYAFYQQGRHNNLAATTTPVSIEDFILIKWKEKIDLIR